MLFFDACYIYKLKLKSQLNVYLYIYDVEIASWSKCVPAQLYVVLFR